MVTAHLISAFVFAKLIVQSLYFLNRKFQGSYRTAKFLLGLVGNPKDKFGHDAAHYIFQISGLRKVYLAKQADLSCTWFFIMITCTYDLDPLVTGRFGPESFRP